MLRRATLELLALAVLLAWSATLRSQATTGILADLNTRDVVIDSRVYGDPVTYRNELYFFSEDGRRDIYLFRVTQDARVEKAVNPGAKGGIGSIGGLSVVGDRLIWWNAPLTGSTLVTSQGSDATTTVIANLPERTSYTVFTAGDRYYFRSASSSPVSRVTDGTAIGTKAADFSPLTDGKFFAALPNGRFLMSIYGPNLNDRLWVSDGTKAGSFDVMGTGIGGHIDGLGDAVVEGGVAYFTTHAMNGEWKVWRSDGTTAGTFALHTDTTIISLLGITPGTVWFGTYKSSQGYFLSTTDGTIAGTKLALQRPHNLASVAFRATRCYFAENSSAGQYNDLWETDGSVAGTRRIPNTLFDPDFLWTHGDFLFTWARRSSSSQRDLHAIDLKTMAISNLTDGRLEPARQDYYDAVEWAHLGSRSMFFVEDPRHGYEPWVTDGSASGTDLLADVGDDNRGSAWPSGGVRFGPHVYFVATDGNAYSYYQTDGTPQVVRKIDTRLNGPSEVAQQRIAAGAHIFYATLNSTLYGCNGTSYAPLATMPGSISEVQTLGDICIARVGNSVHAIEPTGSGVPLSGFTYVRSTAKYGDSMLFLGLLDGKHSITITDGTLGNTRTWLEHPALTTAKSITVAGRYVYFGSTDPVTGEEPWVTDGTQAGTHLIADLEPGSGSSKPFGFTAVGTTVYFVADVSAIGQEVWRYDHTNPPSVVFDAPGNGYAHSLRRFGNDRILFTTEDHFGFLIPWISDGTSSGTSRLLPGTHFIPAGRSGYDMHVAGSRMTYFEATVDRETYGELWTSDGTTAGTHLVADYTKNRYTGAQMLGAVQGRFVYASDSDDYGNEAFFHDFGAGIEPLGDGCRPSGPIPPTLMASAPRLGTTMTFVGEQADPARVAGLFVGAPSANPTPLQHGRCFSWHSVGTEVFLGGAVVSNDTWEYRLPLPNEVSLIGLRVVFFAAVIDDFQTLSIGWTNALDAHLDSR
ncbi:MAG: hypothetical protein KDC95_08715 [Planctomycetes bacterium]|nr:hypothetical protein [Planctomycetota bacterium]